MTGLSAEAAALSLRSVSKRFGVTQALDHVDLAIARGEVVALMGANGAGKSTLAKIASGVCKPDHGQVLIDGREVQLTSPQAARKAGVATVHQSTDQLGVPGLTVAENLLLDELCGAGGGAFVSRRRLHERAQKVADGIGLEIPLDRDFGELGPAQRQLVAIARAVAARALVLIFDEPTASLSAAEAERLFNVIARLRERGVAILYISHRLGDLRRIADRIVVLRNGQRVSEQAKPFDFTAAVQAMIGRSLDEAHRAPRSALVSGPALRMTKIRLTPTARPFDLTIEVGDIVVVTGPLGAGKSRLLGALFGLTRFAGGSVELYGAPWTTSGPAESIAKGVFMAGEDRWRSSLLPPATPGGDIAGTIALPHRRSWFPRGFVDPRREVQAADKIIRALDVRCRDARDTLDLLSGGNQQKVVIGRWRSATCRLLLLDEPFQGVDVGARRDIADALRSVRGQNATLIATSDIEEAVEVADVVVIMRDHTIVGVHDLRASGAMSLIASIAALESSDSEEKGAAA
jgi:simple sugar transport system ATP-binding protein